MDFEKDNEEESAVIIQIGIDGDQWQLTIDGARYLYQQLGKLFGSLDEDDSWSPEWKVVKNKEKK